MCRKVPIPLQVTLRRGWQGKPVGFAPAPTRLAGGGGLDRPSESHNWPTEKSSLAPLILTPMSPGFHIKPIMVAAMERGRLIP